MKKTIVNSLHLNDGSTYKVRYLTNYPFLVLLAYLPFIIYLHRSKIGPQGLKLVDTYEHIIYYHADLSLYVLITTLLWLIKPIRLWSLLIITSLFYLSTLDWFSWQTQSKSFFFSDFYRAFQLIIFYPEFISELPILLKVKAAILLGIPVVLALIFRLQLTARLAQQFSYSLNILAGFLVVATFVTAPWLLSDAYLQQNSIVHIFSEQLHDRMLESIKADRESMKATLGHDNTTTSDLFNLADQNATGDNVIIFIIETAPYPQYPDLGGLAAAFEDPWLKKNSVIFTHHYSTYPATDRATYSILSGQYPPMVLHNKWKERMRYGDTLPKILGRQGYSSYLFSTAPLSFYNDEVMYNNIGFDYLNEVEKTKSLRVKTENGYQWDRARLYDMDEELIQMVIDTMAQHVRTNNKSPFLLSVAPQSSHAPFNCPPQYRENPDACNSDQEKIRVNAQWQFRLIEHLIRELDVVGLLDTTLLVITADHGIRSKHEAADFPNPNLLQQSTFHVPMMLASSRFGGRMTTFNHPTSHVDIAPTIVDILGIPRNDVYFQGRNMFADSPRSIYFIGNGYLPVIGFLQGGIYYMENRYSNLFLSAPIMNFNDRRSVTEDEKTKIHIKKELLRMEAFLRNEYLVTEPLSKVR